MVPLTSRKGPGVPPPRAPTRAGGPRAPRWWDDDAKYWDDDYEWDDASEFAKLEYDDDAAPIARVGVRARFQGCSGCFLRYQIVSKSRRPMQI